MFKLVIFLCFPLLISTNNHPTIYLVGDSTMATKPIEDNPERGWGQVLPLFFGNELTFENHAKNGKSTKSFIQQGLWKNVLDKLKPGDYVFIQFGHNDQKISDTTRYAEAHTLFKRNLIKYVNETREKGAAPVLLTPVNRRKFDKEGKFVDQHGDYPAVVREVAVQMNVPLIDVHKKSEKVFAELGDDKTKDIFLWIPPNKYKSLPEGKTDNTHFSFEGAVLVAGLVVEGIKEIELPIARYLIKNPTIQIGGK